MSADKFKNRYLLEVVVHTQFKEDHDKLEDTIQQMLGPWCSSVEIVSAQETSEK